MERTVPRTASEEVDLYLRTYYSLLRSTSDVQIRTLEEAHAGMRSLLHPGARDTSPDMSAFFYSWLRLPACMPDVDLVVLGQSMDVFSRDGLDIDGEWFQVSAAARRRRCFFDGRGTLACFIASRSDIDDVIPLLTAHQIEWNKLHLLLRQMPGSIFDEHVYQKEQAHPDFADALEITLEDLERLRTIWGAAFAENLEKLRAKSCSLRIRLLSGSLSEYRRATQDWWIHIENTCPELRRRPVYFVSSNTHSVVNLLSGFAVQKKEILVEYLQRRENENLLEEWQSIQTSEVPSNEENFLYYVMKGFQQTAAGRQLLEEQLAYEKSVGITRIPSEHYFDVEAQAIDLSRLNLLSIDSRLQSLGQAAAQVFANSDAMILNIDYPLGLAAYNILSEIADNVGSVLGVYVMGKAATLNGVIGDVMISSVVHDEHSQNTYMFPNSFSAADVSPYLVYGTVLDNQKAVTVQGTFLQTPHYMEVFYREGYTDIEMEAGPYLSAVYEMYRPKRHPVNEIVNLYGLPFDLGIAHYASDTPLSKGKNLGAGNLSYYGMDSTYAVTVATLRRILCNEHGRLTKMQ